MSTVTKNPSSSSSSSKPSSSPSSLASLSSQVSTGLKFAHNGAFIDWQIPPIRTGLLGKADVAIGPGFHLPELLVTLAALAFAIGYLFAVIFPLHPEWGVVKRCWVVFFASNAGWGTVTSTGSFKRWYHFQGDGGIHGWDLLVVFSDVSTQFLICNFLFLDVLGGQWWYAAQYIGFLFAAFSLFRCMPFYLRRPTNVALLTAGAFLATHSFRVIPGMEWFPFVILTKNLLHINREEPYSPLPQVAEGGDLLHHHQQ